MAKSLKTDAERAEGLKKALKKLNKAQDLIIEFLPASDYRVDALFELNRVVVDLERDIAFYTTGELDPIR